MCRVGNSLRTKNIQWHRENIQNKINLSNTTYTDNNFSRFLVINFYETPARSVPIPISGGISWSKKGET